MSETVPAYSRGYSVPNETVTLIWTEGFLATLPIHLTLASSHK